MLLVYFFIIQYFIGNFIILTKFFFVNVPKKQKEKREKVECLNRVQVVTKTAYLKEDNFVIDLKE